MLEEYGLPKKNTKMIKLLYENYTASIVVNEELTRDIKIQSRVRQGWFLSPFIFSIIVDYVMRRVIDYRTGIIWETYGSH